MTNDYPTTNDTGDLLADIVKPPIYSKQAIWGFSFFFTPIFGGVLLMQNLKDIGKNKEGNVVFIISILLTAIMALVIDAIKINVTFINVICNLAAISVLTEYFYKKHFSDAALYVKKKIWKPLIIGIILAILFIALIVVAEEATLSAFKGVTSGCIYA